MSEVAAASSNTNPAWTLPSRGVVGILCLILAEATIFLIFVVAYIFYIGKSISGPTPHDVLSLPIFSSICLLSSSWTVHAAVAALRKDNRGACSLWLAVTVLLGSIFLGATAMEWHHLIYIDGLTIQTNLFGTTFYSLVGLHASHVIAGLIMLALALIFSLRGSMSVKYAEKLDVISLYWHFVDAVWVVVLIVVYGIGR
jgi:cytochrome c oxidase subunit III